MTKARRLARRCLVLLVAVAGAGCNQILGLDEVGPTPDAAPDGGPLPGATMAQQAYLKARQATNGKFGSAVALSADGSTLAVGEPHANSGQGAVYMFTRADGQWALSSQIAVAPMFSTAEDLFGHAVALSADGSVLAVGAHLEDSAGEPGFNPERGSADQSRSDAGAVYLFEQVGDQWQPKGYFKATDVPSANAYFGHAIALAGNGNVLAVGSYGRGGGANGIGRVYTFARDQDTPNAWSGGALSAPEGAAGSGQAGTLFYGYAVALDEDGDTLAVGAPYQACFKQPGSAQCGEVAKLQSGAVYVYQGESPGAWVAPTLLIAPNRDADDAFGEALAMSGNGNTIVVGVQAEDGNGVGVAPDGADNSAPKSGAVYVFDRGADNDWAAPATYIKASNAGMGDNFGHAVAISRDGHMLAVGASTEAGGSKGLVGNEQDNSSANSGALYLFLRKGDVWTQRVYAKASNTGANDLFGSAVALASNGGTVVSGAIQEASNATDVGGDQENNAQPLSGAAYVFFGPLPEAP